MVHCSNIIRMLLLISNSHVLNRFRKYKFHSIKKNKYTLLDFPKRSHTVFIGKKIPHNAKTKQSTHSSRFLPVLIHILISTISKWSWCARLVILFIALIVEVTLRHIGKKKARISDLQDTKAPMIYGSCWYGYRGGVELPNRYRSKSQYGIDSKLR